MNLSKLIGRYEYRSDSDDLWRVIRPDHDGVYRGDCEDFALSVLYYVVCNESWLKFWWLLLTGKAKVCYAVTKNDTGHAVLRYGNSYIDSWTRQWVDREHMDSLGHKFHGSLFGIQHVAVRMLKLNIYYQKLSGTGMKNSFEFMMIMFVMVSGIAALGLVLLAITVMGWFS